ncbi:MAG: GNAT family N-acetyltransferase [Treponema sp.]|jgi:predicted GNAT family acetyltransferase|nr:GNAT family N-acetyltransferase [Treponema sp.]
MRFNLYSAVKDFYRDTYDVLARHEAQNLIPLGNVIIGNDGSDKNGWRDPANWFMATVTDGSGIALTAIMTPPHNLTLYATDNQIDDEAIACLIKGIGETNFTVPGVMTEKALAERFAKAWSTEKDTKYTVQCDQRIYELIKVNPAIPLKGVLRLVEEKDMPFLPYWIEGFNCDCFGHTASPKPDPDPYRYHINKKKLYVLEDNGVPVAMASMTREMRTVCGVGQVYTPPYFRRKGYATSCVAGVSRLVLERGFAKCVLYTDLANPISNSIYQKIGYTPICDSLMIKIDD